MHIAHTLRPDFEVTKLRMAMLARGLDSRSLAAQASVNLRSLQNLLSGCHRSWPLRRRLNRFFRKRIFNPDFSRGHGRPRNPTPKNT
jgi:hypothetical protein